MRTGFLAALVVVAVAAGGGYWAGARHEGTGGDAVKKERKILFYRNPMGLPDTSPVPKKDPMGMDYIPVYEGEDTDDSGSGSQIRIGTEKVQKTGVRTEAVRLARLERVVRAAGRIEQDERRTYAIAPKFEGYVERLHVNATGQRVAKGQPLFEVYSPELVSAQREYRIARQATHALEAAGVQAQSAMNDLADASLLRLRNWDIPGDQLEDLARGGQSKRTLTMRSPVAGVVTEKKALQGMRFMPGETLYQVADLSTVWVVADVFEQDIALVRPGTHAKVRIDAYPGRQFEGVITYVYPTLRAETRTVPVRLELPNPGTLLKPGMYADVELPVAARGDVAVVPNSAVIDSGVRSIVLVEKGEGRFEPREVQLGARGDNDVEVRGGVKVGEKVVVAGNFLIDAESNLRTAIGGFGTQAGEPAGVQGAAPKVGHQGKGKVESVDPAEGTVSISHGPIASLRWPAMTMDFKVANDSLLKVLEPGESVSFEFVERAQGEWVITAAQAVGGAGATRDGGTAKPRAATHAGH